jgi:hypothetical protein
MGRLTAPRKTVFSPGCFVAKWWRAPGKSLGKQLQELFVKVGSFRPRGEKFRLTRIGETVDF